MTTSPLEGTDPTRPAPERPAADAPGRGFLFFLGLAAVGAGMANLVPLVLTLSLKATVIDPANPAAVLSVAVAVGAVFSLVAFPALGRLSDRTTGRSGRRRPFLAGAAVLFLLGAVVTALAGNVLTLVLGGIATAIGFSAAAVAYTAAIPDQLPPDRRGPASAIVGLSLPLGAVIGLFIAQLLAPNLIAMILAPAVVAAIGAVAFAVVLRDRPLAPADRPPFGGRDLARTFWVSPRRSPNFAWAWISRLLLFLGVAAIQAYQALYLVSELGFTPDQVAGAVFLSTLVLTVAALVFALVAGKLSDRVGRRKPFVIGSAALFAAGLAMASFADSFGFFLVATAVVGIGQGIYFAVDLALVTLVLPDPDTAAKDLGIMNLANTLPAAIVPALAPLVLAVGAGGGSNYTALFLSGAVAALLGAVLIVPIRGVR